jgi:signal peptidase II
MRTRLHAMRRLYFASALVILVLDRLTKWLVEERIALHDSISILPGFFRLTHVQNRGAAFGLFADSPSEWKVAILVGFSLLALGVVSTLLWRNSHTPSVTGAALALILGGAVGNLWDRVLSGHVVDFLDFYIDGHHWPAFNVADSAIVVGACLLVGEILFRQAPGESVGVPN